MAITRSQYRIPYDFTKEDLELRDALIEELKERTGATLVNIIAYSENQRLSPYTISPDAIILEGRLGNCLVRLVVTKQQVEMSRGPMMYYHMRELSNRLMDSVLKAGAASL